MLGDNSKALCRICKCEIRAHCVDLVQHASTETHKILTYCKTVHTVYFFRIWNTSRLGAVKANRDFIDPSFFVNILVPAQMSRKYLQPLFQRGFQTFEKWMQGQYHFRALTAWEIFKIGINLMNTWHRKCNAYEMNWSRTMKHSKQNHAILDRKNNLFTSYFM